MVIFDSSALIAIIYRERGWEIAEKHRAEAIMSAVNAAEVITRLINGGAEAEEASSAFIKLGMETIDLDDSLAIETGRLRAETRHLGLSLGDRACLALARSRGLPVYTSDRAWADLDVGLEVVLIR